MKITHLIIIIISTVLFIGCATPATTLMSIEEKVSLPEENEIRTGALGDTLVFVAKTHQYNGMYLKNEVKGGDGLFMQIITVPSQYLAATLENNKWVFYFGRGVTAYDPIIGTRYVEGGLKISKTTAGKIAVFGLTLRNTLEPRPKPDIKFMKVTNLDKPYFVKLLIYNGKREDTVKFLYKETSKDRIPYTQNIEYDLADGNIIGFNGMEIEILEATNTNLAYRMLKNFPDY